jgi:two-component system, OmpR family, response regulator QseB
MRILLVEDDSLLGEGIMQALKQEGNIVDWVKDGLMAEAALYGENSFDIIILDIGLPKKSGLEVLRDLRRKNIHTPVLMLTARCGLNDRVEGLDSGADDYLVKPFELAEISARLRALSRRSQGRSNPVIKFKNLTLDPAGHTVTVDNQVIKVSRREFALLHTLLANAGRVISRTRMVDALYGWDEEIDSNALEVHVHNLRKKIGGNLIQTIRGVGYIVRTDDE